MSYEAIGSGSISLNTMTAMEQKNLQAALLERYPDEKIHAELSV